MKESINKHLEEVKKFGIPEDRILGVFLYGSQNYGTNTPNSDVDTKAIFIPKAEDALLHAPMLNKELHLENGEHCEVMDIRHLVNNFKKQNINFVEVLFTSYYWLNPKYEELWNTYFKNIRDEIARYDMGKAVESICGQAIHTLNQNKYDGKKLANGWRLCYFLDEYLNGSDYKHCIIPNLEARASMQLMKQGQLKIDNSMFADQLLKDLEEIRTEWREGKYEDHSSDKMLVDIMMDKGILEMIREGNHEFFNRENS